MGKYKSRLVFATVGIFVASLPGMGAFLVRDSLWTTVLITSAFTVLCMPVATLLYVVGSDVGGSSRGTLTGILSGSGYGSYALGAVIGGLGGAPSSLSSKDLDGKPTPGGLGGGPGDLFGSPPFPPGLPRPPNVPPFGLARPPFPGPSLFGPSHLGRNFSDLADVFRKKVKITSYGA